MTINLVTIIKRLNLIKNLIALEEEKDIAEHLVKLEQLEPSKELREIISLLQEKSYGKAVKQIEGFINLHQQILIYSDPEIGALKLEVKSLEILINSLSNEKADIEKLIHEFGVRHNNELGELIIKILRYRKENAKGSQQQRETEEDYNSYHKEFDASKNREVAILTDEDQKELKDKYRKASKLCHPDVVSEDQKELATKLFAELNTAYEMNDIVRVRDILQNLETGHFFINKSDSINEKQLLINEIEKQRFRINDLKQQLRAIKESDTYQTISGIRDWNEYFANAQQKLRLQINELEGGQ